MKVLVICKQRYNCSDKQMMDALTWDGIGRVFAMQCLKPCLSLAENERNGEMSVPTTHPLQNSQVSVASCAQAALQGQTPSQETRPSPSDLVVNCDVAPAL